MVVKKEIASKESVEPVEVMVSVEMTEKQKDAFSKFMAEEEKAKEAEAVKEPILQIDLRFGHNVNGRPYGPGQVRCPEGLAYSLLERDQVATRARLRVHEGSEFMINILGAGRAEIKEIIR